MGHIRKSGLDEEDTGMNNARRKRLAEIAERISDLGCDIEEIMNEEQEARDNMPENMQESERGERMAEIIDNLQGAIDALEDVHTTIEEAAE